MQKDKKKLKIEKFTVKKEGRIIFNNLEIEAFSGDKIMIVGENGIGKSTFLKLLRGNKSTHLLVEGKIAFDGSIGYLPQTFSEFSERNIIEHLTIESQNKNFIDLYYKKLNNEVDEFEWKKQINQLGWFNISKVVAQLGLEKECFFRKIGDLSGGQKVKYHLAALNYLSPDLLLLDEPTNNLDEEGRKWIEKFLNNYAGIVILTTHDRYLIEKVANHIYEICPETKKLIHFRGNYKSYLKEKEREYQRAKQLRASQEKEINDISKKLKKIYLVNKEYKPKVKNESKLGFDHRGARYNRSQKRITNQLKGKRENIEANLARIPSMSRRKFEIEFNASISNFDSQIKVLDVAKILEEKILFQNLNFNIKNKERILIKGRNGIGKSTLLKIIMGLIEKDKGVIEFSPEDLIIGYLNQEQEDLNMESNLIQFFNSEFNWKLTEEKLYEKLINLGIFYPKEIFSKISELSVGCQRKMQMMKIIWQEPDILILDEPTNHIDLLSLEKIEDWLINFKGPILIVSHDKYFIEKLCNKFVNLEEFS